MKNLRIVILTLIIVSAGFFSCKKSPTKIGSNLQSSATYVKVFSTHDNEIIASTQRVDSLLTTTSTSLLVGHMYDEIFGTTNLQTYTQFSLSIADQKWGDGAVPDSIILQLCYNGYYGDTTTMQNYIVRELDEDFADSTNYYSNRSMAKKSFSLAEHYFQPHPNTFSNIDDDSLTKAVLRIPLDISLAQSFIDNEDAFEANDKFMEFFKGLNIESSASILGKGCICLYDATNSYTYIRMYYHNNTDTLTYDLKITSSNMHYGEFHHSYEDAVAPISFNDTTDMRYLYVQGAAGTMVWIKFPQIIEWAKSLNANIIINEAKLIMKGAPETVFGAINDTANFPPMVQLVAVEKTGEGTYNTLDDQLVSAAYFGGQYKSNGTVFFRLNRYIQDLIKYGLEPEYDNQGLYIFVSGGSLTPRRWVFDGPQFADTTGALRLELTYSLF